MSHLTVVPEVIEPVDRDPLSFVTGIHIRQSYTADQIAAIAVEMEPML